MCAEDYSSFGATLKPLTSRTSYPDGLGHEGIQKYPGRGTLVVVQELRAARSSHFQLVCWDRAAATTATQRRASAAAVGAGGAREPVHSEEREKTAKEEQEKGVIAPVKTTVERAAEELGSTVFELELEPASPLLISAERAVVVASVVDTEAREELEAAKREGEVLGDWGGFAMPHGSSDAARQQLVAHQSRADRLHARLSLAEEAARSALSVLAVALFERDAFARARDAERWPCLLLLDSDSLAAAAAAACERAHVSSEAARADRLRCRLAADAEAAAQGGACFDASYIYLVAAQAVDKRDALLLLRAVHERPDIATALVPAAKARITVAQRSAGAARGGGNRGTGRLESVRGSSGQSGVAVTAGGGQRHGGQAGRGGSVSRTGGCGGKRGRGRGGCGGPGGGGGRRGDGGPGGGRGGGRGNESGDGDVSSRTPLFVCELCVRSFSSHAELECHLAVRPPCGEGGNRKRKRPRRPWRGRGNQVRLGGDMCPRTGPIYVASTAPALGATTVGQEVLELRGQVAEKDGRGKEPHRGRREEPYAGRNAGPPGSAQQAPEAADLTAAAAARHALGSRRQAEDCEPGDYEQDETDDSMGSNEWEVEAESRSGALFPLGEREAVLDMSAPAKPPSSPSSSEPPVVSKGAATEQPLPPPTPTPINSTFDQGRLTEARGSETRQLTVKKALLLVKRPLSASESEAVTAALDLRDEKAELVCAVSHHLPLGLSVSVFRINAFCAFPSLLWPRSNICFPWFWQRRHAERLNEKRWLTDEVMDAYMAHLNCIDGRLCDADPERKSTLFLSTNFFQKVTPQVQRVFGVS